MADIQTWQEKLLIDLREYAVEYMHSHSIKSKKEFNEQDFKAMCCYAFKDLIEPEYRQAYVTSVKSNGHLKYKQDVISDILDIYLILTDEFNIIPSVRCFSRLVGIDPHTLRDWNNSNIYINISNDANSGIDKLNTDSSVGNIDKGRAPGSSKLAPVKKILGEREESIKDSLLAAGAPIGRIAVANAEFGWDKPQQKAEKVVVIQKTAEEIAAQYGGLIEKS